MFTRILPKRTWAMTQIGDIIDTFTGDTIVIDIKNGRGGSRTVILDNGRIVDALTIGGVNTNNTYITIRRPIPRFRAAGVTIADRVSDQSVINAAIARKYAEANTIVPARL